MNEIIEEILKIFKEILSKMSDDELNKIYEMLKESADKKKYYFNYQYISKKFDDKPYVAKLEVKNGQLERKFINLQQEKQNDGSMKYSAKIEIDPEGIYEIKEKGKYLIYVLDDENKKIKLIGERNPLFKKIMSYLKKEITKSDLITAKPEE